MIIEDKFRFLDIVGFSKEEAKAYFKLSDSRKNRKLSEGMRYKTNLAVAYRRVDGELERQYYLDLSRISQVCGIYVADVCFDIKAEEDVSPEHARNVKRVAVFGSKKFVYCRPTDGELRLAFVHKNAFNDIIDILRAYGVPAKRWDNKYHYLCSAQASMSDTYDLDMDNGWGEKARNSNHNAFRYVLKEIK